MRLCVCVCVTDKKRESEASNCANLLHHAISTSSRSSPHLFVFLSVPPLSLSLFFRHFLACLDTLRRLYTPYSGNDLELTSCALSEIYQTYIILSPAG